MENICAKKKNMVVYGKHLIGTMSEITAPHTTPDTKKANLSRGSDYDLRNDDSVEDFAMRTKCAKNTAEKVNAFRSGAIVVGMQMEPDLVLFYTKEAIPRLLLLQKDTGESIIANSFATLREKLERSHFSKKVEQIQDTRGKLGLLDNKSVTPTGVEVNPESELLIQNIATVMEMTGGQPFNKFYGGNPSQKINLDKREQLKSSVTLPEAVLRGLNREISIAFGNDPVLMDSMAEQESGYDAKASGKSLGL